MKKKYIWALILFVSLVGCQGSGTDGNHDADRFQIMFISSISQSYQEPLQAYIEELLSDQLDEHISVNVAVTLPSYDKLTIEIFNKEVDMFVVDSWLDQVLIDPYGLIPLDDYVDHFDNTARLNPFIRENQEGTAEHVYALPLSEEMTFIQDMGFDLEDEWLVGVVATSPHQSLARQLIEEWL
ncbi:hypothetical protein [Amphibacillus cookii]|uniref:hypothetical protein n=1 Tax=Amphibacillus cookii TaxID=767787 RepID=UPI00195E8BF9|nr:hypothetical protein [Amphibacillus cookii]MBM7542622.1 hypothetical protein [Amphibacillus cookii]